MKLKILSSFSLTSQLFFFYLKPNLIYTLTHQSNSEFKDDKRQSKSQKGAAIKSGPMGFLKRTGLQSQLVQSAFDSLKPSTSTFWGSSSSSPSLTVWDLLPGSQKVPGLNWSSKVALGEKKRTKARGNLPHPAKCREVRERGNKKQPLLSPPTRKAEKRQPLLWQLKSPRDAK